MCTWVALKTSVNSWDHPTEISLRFFVSLWNSSSGILGFLVCDQNWEKIEKEWYRFWDFPSHYRVLASHDRRHDESNIGGFNKCSHNNLQLYNRAGPRGYQVWPFWWVSDGLPSKSVLIKLGLHTAHDISWHVKSQDLLFSKLGFFSLSFFSFSCFRSGICICFQNPNSKITKKKKKRLQKTCGWFFLFDPVLFCAFPWISRRVPKCPDKKLSRGPCTRTLW